MKFHLIDRILELESGRSLLAVKNLSLTEEYLADHFPGFPVMPGVLMLEALTQAGAWLVRESEDFAHSIILLKRAKTIKYGSFVEPGRQLQVRVEMIEKGPRECSFKGEGTCDGTGMLKGRFTLERYNLRDKSADLHVVDSHIVSGLREQFVTLRKGSIGSKAMARPVMAQPSPVGAGVVERG